MKATKTTLPNKLRVLATHIPSIESATVNIWVRTGSRFETPKIQGISHFLEHMVFKGSKKRPSARAISEVVDAMGGEFNAGTAKEFTNFYIKARAGMMDRAFDVLSDMIINPLILPEEVEREKGVICEEIAMYEDTPMAKIGDLFENLIYKGSTLANDIAGTCESVRGITKADFVSYRNKYYYAENMLISVAGGITEEKAHTLATKYLMAIDKKGEAPKKPNDKLMQTKPEVFLKTKKTDQAHLIIGYKGAPAGAKTRYAEGILSTILGGSMSSRLFLEVRERRGLAYAIKTVSDHSMDNGYLGAYAGVRLDKIEEAIKVILEEFQKISNIKYPISNAELEKAKEFVKGHIALSLEDTKEASDFFAMDELLLGEIRTPDEVFAAIDKVTVEEVVAIAKDYFRPERLNLAVIGPFEDREKFVRLLK